MTRRRRRGRVLRWIALLALVAWTAGFLLFVHAIPGPASQATRHADAIVVPTGGGERLPAGIALLQAGVADRMFVSGVHSGVDVATILDLNSQAPTTLACCIELGHNADHSVGNARETATWMASAGRKSMYLVTASFHMPRSLMLFRRLMPEVEIIPWPVAPDTVRLDIWWRHPRSLAVLATEYAKYLVNFFWPPA